MGNIKIVRGVFDTKLELEHAGVAAGFPSPADDYRYETLDFNRDYIRHPEASFYGNVEGDSMKDAGLFDGDRVIIDRAVEPHDAPRPCSIRIRIKTDFFSDTAVILLPLRDHVPLGVTGDRFVSRFKNINRTGTCPHVLPSTPCPTFAAMRNTGRLC